MQHTTAMQAQMQQHSPLSTTPVSAGAMASNSSKLG